jgi:hypothetical protein
MPDGSHNNQLSLNRRTTMTDFKFNHTFADLAKFDKFFVGSDKFLSKVQETADYLANKIGRAHV